MLLCYAKVGPLFMKYPISDEISDFSDIQLFRYPNPIFCISYPNRTVSDLVLSDNIRI